jgi:hypothetical protein
MMLMFIHNNFKVCRGFKFDMLNTVYIHFLSPEHA